MSADTTTAPPAAAEASAPTQLTMAGALNAALRDAMAADDRVIVYGEDVGPLGGVFRVTDGLQAQFGEDRIWDSPLAESGIVGTAIGMAMYGMRPVVEMQFDAFSYPAFEQMVSHVAKMRNRTKGRVTLPMVVRIPCAGAIGGVEHHSDSSEAYWTSTPGLTVVMPSNPADAYSMLREAIDSDDPVVFMEPKSRYWSKAPLALPVTTAPMDRAEVVREGTDVTLIAYGPTVRTALEAADAAADEGLSIEVVDLRSLSSLRRRDGRRIRSQDVAGRRDPRGGAVRRLRRRGRRPGHRAQLPPSRRARAAHRGLRHPVPVAEARGVPPADRRPRARRARHLGVGRMSREFILPDLGEGLTEAEIVAWLVAPGDEVAIDQPIVELESAKSVVQLPTPFAGVVESLGGEVGEVIHAGSVLMTLAAAGADADTTPAAAASPAVDGSADASSAEPASEGSGAVLIGYGTKQSTVTKRHASAPARFGRRPAAAGGGGSSAPRTASGGSRLDAGRRSPVVSPIVRRIAREHGFDASQLDGSGPDHLVMRRDVESFISDELGTAAAPAATSAAPVAPTTAQARCTLAQRAVDRRGRPPRSARPHRPRSCRALLALAA